MAVTGDLKWRHDLKDIEAMAASQAAILQSAARLLKPGGRLVLSIKSGERIHPENSYKYTLAGMSALLQNAGFTQTRCWTDPQDRFAVYWASVHGAD